MEVFSTCVCEYEGQRFRFEVASIVRVSISRLCSRYLRKGSCLERKREKRARSFEREYTHAPKRVVNTRKNTVQQLFVYYALRILKISPLNFEKGEKETQRGIRQPSKISRFPKYAN